VLSACSGTAYGLVCVLDGTDLLTASQDGIERWIVETRQRVHPPAGLLDCISCIAFSPTELRFATGPWGFSC